MFVKSIQCKNFKSFKNCFIQLEKKFNVIIGPNGSGKSNSIDSILFCFGETSLRAMRVKSIKDLIYRDAKVAQVTITLESNEGKENTISRMVRKDGKTKYMLDGKTVKKYVLQEFLLKNRLSTSNVILQGQVQRICEMNSKDRRGLVDQVSNLSEWEMKKKEALSELAKADSNLKESLVLLNSKLGYLEELKKEMEQAQKYTTLKNRMDSIKATILTIDVNLFSKEFENLIKELGDSNSKLTKIENELLEINTGINSLQSEKDTINKKIMEEGQGREVEIQKEIDFITMEIEKTKALVQVRTDFIKNFEEKNRSFLNQRQRNLDAIKSVESDASYLKNEVKELDLNLDSLQKEYDSLFSSKEKFSEKFFEAQKIVKDAEDSQLKVKERLSELQAQLEKQREIMAFKEGEVNKLKSGSFDFSSNNDDTKNLEENMRQLKHDLALLDSEVQKEFEKERKLNKRLSEVDSLILGLKEDVAVLNSKLKYYQEDTRVSDLLSSFKGFHGKLESLITFDLKYSVPIQVALGARLNYYVVDSVDTAQKCIQRLKETKSGRVSFIPLNKIQYSSSNTRDLSKDNACKGFIIDFIEYNSEFANAVKYACSDTLLFTTLQDAKKNVGKARIVTMEGELLEPSGLISGGFTQNKTNLAMEKKSLDEKSGKLNALQSEKDSVIQELYSIRENHSGQRKKQAETELKIKEIEIRLESFAKENETYSKAKTNLKETIKELNKGVQDCLKEISKIEEEKKDLIRVLSELNMKILDSKSQIDLEKQEQYGNLIQQKEKKLMELKILINEKQADLKNYNNQITSQQRELDSLELNFKDQLKEKEESEKLLTEYSSTIKNYKESLKTKIELQKNISGKLKDFYEKRTELETKINTHANKRGKLEFEREKLKDQSRDKEVRHAVLRDKLATLKAELMNYDKIEVLTSKAEADKPELMVELKKIDGEIYSLGNVNLKAPEIYSQKEGEVKEQKTRVEQLENENKAILNLIQEIDVRKKETFMNAYNVINDNFKKLFSNVFRGQGSLYLENPEDPLEAGLTMQVKLDKGEVKYLELMSGGEKSLIALMFIFAIQNYNPTSIYILDEADAALDQENSRKLGELVKQLSKNSQTIMISHNAMTPKYADNLIGITMSVNGSVILEVNAEWRKKYVHDDEEVKTAV
ncbi:Chromosome partition protein Smc [uncultured archaeon]|nr:Chromosome partition protein Smc [uncultured archaeon]